MKVLYISHSHPPKNAMLENIGGMQRVSMQLITEFKRRNDIQLYPVVLESPWDQQGPRTFLFLLTLLVELPVRVYKIKPDVILFSSMVTASLSFFLRKVIDIPMVTINHGQDVTLPVWIYQRFLPMVFKRLDGVISVSNATREACIERGMARNKGSVIPNGYPVEDSGSIIGKKVARNYISDKFGIKLRDSRILISVGRQVRRKGHYWFIDRVLPNIKSDFVYILLGDGPEHEKIRSLVEERRLGNKVWLIGKQSDLVLHNLYAAADLFIMPNINVSGDMEGFGIVLLEANVRGVPVIATRLEGIRDVISEGVNGFGVEPGDYKAFSEKIDEVLKKDLTKFSDLCRGYVEKKYDWKIVAGQYLSNLKHIVKQFYVEGQSADEFE